MKRPFDRPECTEHERNLALDLEPPETVDDRTGTEIVWDMV